MIFFRVNPYVIFNNYTEQSRWIQSNIFNHISVDNCYKNNLYVVRPEKNSLDIERFTCLG